VLTLLTASTPRDLARRIGAELSAAPAPYDPIVALQTKGTKTPLFCVHPGVGEVLVFVGLAKFFAHERPFYALRARGFDGEPPFGTFAEMVGAYVDAIRKRQPHGPYAIAGYSFGAAVAFEIAKVLEEEGERVAFLGNFNLPAHIQQRMNELDSTETALNLALFLDLITEHQSQTLSADLRRLPSGEQLTHLMEISEPARLAELGMDAERFTAWANLATAMTGLGRTYQPAGRTRSSMTVFCAEPLHGTRYDWLEHQLRSWDDYTTGPNRYIDVPGEHYTLMGPQHVTAFQAILRAELDSALQGH
jgi:thioesterase domain-containing protein